MARFAQVALEALISTGFALAIMAVVLGYAFFIYTDSIAVSTAQSAAKTVVNMVDQVYVLGPRTVLFTSLNVPKNVTDAQLFAANARTTLVLKLQTSSGITDLSETASTLFDFYPGTSSVFQVEGRYRFKVFWNSLGDNIKVCNADELGNCLGVPSVIPAVSEEAI